MELLELYLYFVVEELGGLLVIIKLVCVNKIVIIGVLYTSLCKTILTFFLSLNVEGV